MIDLLQLNLIRKLQEALLARTEQVHAQLGLQAGEPERRLLQRLSEEQRRLAEVMSDFRKKTEGAEE